MAIIHQPHQVCLELEDFRIRPWQEGDETSLAQHANNRKIWRNVRDHFPSPYTMNDAKLWIKIANADATMLSLALEVDAQAVGGIGVIFKDDVYRHTAEMGYWLGESYWNRGITSRAVRVISDHIFAHYDITRLYAGIFEHNHASARVLEKAGYTFEARLQQNVTKDGETLDELIYAKLK